MERTKIKWLLGKYDFIFIVFKILVLTSRQGFVISSSNAGVLEFTIEPRDTIVSLGGNAVLDCAATSGDHNRSKIMIEWQDLHGQPVTFIGDTYRSQLTNNSLYISHVGEQTAGYYRCRATLPNGWRIVSRRAKLKAAKLDGWLSEPNDLSIRVGDRAYFACKANVAPQNTVKYKWFKDGRPFYIDELRMALLPSGSLEIDDVQMSDAGTYHCNATLFGAQQISKSAQLSVQMGEINPIENLDEDGEPLAPKFVAIPNDLIAIEGETITFDCLADGRPRPQVTWLKDGRAIDFADLDTRYSRIGAAGHSLQVSSVGEQDAGTYTCRADNGEDSSDSAAQLQVLVPPRLSRRPHDRLGQINTDAEFRCEAQGHPTPKITWLKNGEQITYNDYLTLIDGHDLKISGLIDTDTGIFQCVATNEAGEVQASARLKVIGQDHNKRKKARPPYNKKPAKSFSHDIFSSLIEDSERVDPHAVFSSLRSDAVGPALTAFTQHPLEVHQDQLLGENNDNVPGQPIDLRALMVKARSVTLGWRSPLNTGRSEITSYNVFWREEGSPRERVQNTTRGRLEEASISGLSPGRVYVFRVVAHNLFGAGPTSDQLTVVTQAEENVPSAPRDVRADPISAQSLKIHWLPPDITRGQLRGYTLYYMEQDTGLEHNVDLPAEKNSYQLENLMPFTSYSIWLSALNENGLGTASKDVTVRTFGSTPSEAPYNVTIEASGATSLTVRWEPPPEKSKNGIITGYKLRYRKIGKKGDTITTPGDARSYTLTGLERATSYQLRLNAININGTGPATDWITAETYENDLDESSVPNEPSPMRVRPSVDNIQVAWGPPLENNIVIRKYILGWGKGIPDIYSEELDEKIRQFTIPNLEPNSEYVISLRASNNIGPGRARYANVRTRDESSLLETQTPLMPPVGLKAQVLSSTTVVLYWTDATSSKSQYPGDQRYYVVKYAQTNGQKYRTYNSTDMNCMITDLRPNTQYEFTVKLVKGRRESPWSMVVTNVTFPSAPGTAPRDLAATQYSDGSILLTWQPPKLSNGPITGYVIFYTTDVNKRDRDWIVEGVLGDKQTVNIYGLEPHTTYYFKIQARNNKGVGPFSTTVSFRTSHGTGVVGHDRYKEKSSNGIFSTHMVLYLIIGGSVIGVTMLAVLLTIFCCRRNEPNTGTPDRSKKAYQKSQNVNPPDLWIHHDQMELKSLEKGGGSTGGPNNDGASSSGATTLPRSVAASDYETHTHERQALNTNSLDKRTYMPGYMGAQDDPSRRPSRPKPIMLPVESKPPREPIATATPINPPIDLSRPSYPRTQYTMSRAHVTLDHESPYAPSAPVGTGNLNQFDPPMGGYGQTGSYAPGMNIVPPPQNPIQNQPPVVNMGEKRPGHPLKSFSVPAPPPTSAPSTPHSRSPAHVVRPGAGSPYKKLAMSSGGSPVNTSRISQSNPPPHTQEEIQRLAPSQSTEELNQEMANLEGLMKDLSAITANQFEC